MALIEIHPQLSKTNELLERIARAMEVDVLNRYHVRLGHCAEKLDDPNPGEQPETTYTTDSSSIKNELLAISKGQRPDVIDDDDDWTRA